MDRVDGKTKAEGSQGNREGRVESDGEETIDSATVVMTYHFFIVISLARVVYDSVWSLAKSDRVPGALTTALTAFKSWL